MRWRKSRGLQRATLGASALVSMALGVPSPCGATAAAAVTTAPRTPLSTLTCATPYVPMYHVDGLAQLRRWSLTSAVDGSGGWTEQQIGSGWTGLTVVSGGSGTLFAIDTQGNLRWYQDTGFAGIGGAAWNPASGSAIGTGWGGLTAVTSGGQGVIYAVDSSGRLHWYRYLGTNGSNSWDPASGAVIGTGWNGLQIVGSGSGIIYAVNSSGVLFWYRHLDPTGGTASWADSGVGQQIGTGWAFTATGSMGGGVLLARDSTGALRWYRHTDPLGGTAAWANSGIGVSQGAGWDGAAVVADVAGCTAS